jgi:hypothetical protein
MTPSRFFSTRRHCSYHLPVLSDHASLLFLFSPRNFSSWVVRSDDSTATSSAVPRRPEPTSKDPIELPPSFPTLTLHSIQADEATVSEELGIVHRRTRLSPPLATNRLRPTIKEHRRSPPTPCQSSRPCQPIATKNFQVSPTLLPTSAPSISSFAPPFSNYFEGEQLRLELSISSYTKVSLPLPFGPAPSCCRVQPLHRRTPTATRTTTSFPL